MALFDDTPTVQVEVLRLTPLVTLPDALADAVSEAILRAWEVSKDG